MEVGHHNRFSIHPNCKLIILTYSHTHHTYARLYVDPTHPGCTCRGRPEVLPWSVGLEGTRDGRMRTRLVTGSVQIVQTRSSLHALLHWQ